MPQHLHRREFIQASVAAAGAIAAAGLLPGAARAASWTTIDAQVHAYERNHPGRPWAGTLVGPSEMTGDQMVAAMDAVGVDGAVLVSPFSMYRYDPSYVLEVVGKAPGPVLPGQAGRSERSCDCRQHRRLEGEEGYGRRPDPHARRCFGRSGRPRPQPGAGGGGEALIGGKPVVLGPIGTGRTIGGPQSEHAARHRPSGLTAAARAAAAGAALGRFAEGAGARGLSQCCDQDHRRLHTVARAVPVQGHLGSARPHLRRL